MQACMVAHAPFESQYVPQSETTRTKPFMLFLAAATVERSFAGMPVAGPVVVPSELAEQLPSPSRGLLAEVSFRIITCRPDCCSLTVSCPSL